jgi:hypothetical protein
MKTQKLKFSHSPKTNTHYLSDITVNTDFHQIMIILNMALFIYLFQPIRKQIL